MKKNYIKLNIDDNHLSFGNLCRLIKTLSKNKSSAMQGEVFSILFNTDIVNDTTVNNYCVGVRGINDTYKQIYLNYRKKYEKDKEILKPTITRIISIMDGIIQLDNIDINKSTSLKLLCNKLYNISKNDKSCTEEFTNRLHDLLEDNNLLQTFSEILFFCILDKKQPIYESELKVEIIETVLNDTNISASDLQKYLNIKLSEEVNFNMNLKKLSEAGNAYACFELGLQEFRGYYAGYPRYMEALKYFKEASKSNHGQSYYMIARLYYEKFIGNHEEKEMEYAWDCLNKSIKLGCVAAINLKGLFYLRGILPVNKDLKLAKKYFEEAASKEYSYAYNNLGLMLEKTDYEKAVEYYKKSAELGDAWGLNRLGEYYRKNGNHEEAFNCYIKSIDVPFENICPYAYYNLAKYYYLNGNSYINLSKDEHKAINYLEIAVKHDNLDACLELLNYYVKKYLNKKDDELFNTITTLVKQIENNSNYNLEIKKQIENNFIKLKEDKSINLDIIK